MKTRAIYVGDVRFNSCDVFELNEKTREFEMMNDKDFKYDEKIVKKDKEDWIMFKVSDDEIVTISR